MKESMPDLQMLPPIDSRGCLDLFAAAWKVDSNPDPDLPRPDLAYNKLAGVLIKSGSSHQGQKEIIGDSNPSPLPYAVDGIKKLYREAGYPEDEILEAVNRAYYTSRI